MLLFPSQLRGAARLCLLCFTTNTVIYVIHGTIRSTLRESLLHYAMVSSAVYCEEGYYAQYAEMLH